MTYDDAYKQWLIQKITSGSYDYTYGPGSPSPTPSDMKQTIGARDNPLSTGDIALPPEDYKLFTPEERQKYRIADTSFFDPNHPTPRGSVEGYFGADAQKYNGPYPATTPPPFVAQGDSYNASGMSSWNDYRDSQSQQDAQNKARGQSVSKGFNALGSGISGSGKKATALAMLQQNPVDPRLAALAQNPDQLYQQLYGNNVSPLQALLNRPY